MSEMAEMLGFKRPCEKGKNGFNFGHTHAKTLKPFNVDQGGLLCFKSWNKSVHKVTYGDGRGSDFGWGAHSAIHIQVICHRRLHRNIHALIDQCHPNKGN